MTANPPCPSGEETPYTLLIRQDWGRWYNHYLNSEHWKVLRQKVLNRDDETCQDCGEYATDIHHLTYENVGNEALADLVSLCRKCHHRKHRKKSERF